ncbi:MAG: hypothetical protein LBJ39_02630 [Tannerellaceae bacterium]|jgi:hypothetical protein|nr:hypothetical protein [Tannerellaceae bacterium]
MRAFIYACCMFFLISACDSDTGTFPIDSEKELSHVPEGEILIVPANVVADFSGDELMAGNIHSEYGMAPIDTVSTFGGLARLYESRRPTFEYFYSSYFSTSDDNDYVFPKIEYMLAQECVQDDCSSDMRKAVLRIAVDKQKQKYEEARNSHTARRTGIFLMAVILAAENDAAFVAAVKKDADFRNALLLDTNIRADKEFGYAMIRYAGAFLYYR